MRLGTGVRLTHITAQLGHGLQERNASGGSAYSHHCATRYITVRRRGSVRCYALLTAVLSPMGLRPPAEGGLPSR